MFIVTCHCGRCGNLVDFRFFHVGGSGSFEPTALAVKRPTVMHRAPSVNSGEEGPTVRAHAVGICPRCNDPTLFDFTTRKRYIEDIRKNLNETQGLVGGSTLITITATFPPVREPETDPAWPESLLRQFSDAQRMLDQDMTPSTITATCRTVLDIATKCLDDTLAKLSLQKRIDQLLSSGVITKPIADWGHAIRLDGNEAVHEGIGNRRDAEQYVAFLKMFLNMAFSLPKRISERSADDL
ncbi:MAG: DUF4145 domain-containing protein [Rhizobium sp.]|nr:DUF4145 domain-containing protein [Rhizobium sp.]MBW8319273.1 DUF4145 domain-containing protein [Rhizobium sp.]